MSETAFVVTVLVAVALVLGVVTVVLGRQLRTLRSEVERLGQRLAEPEPEPRSAPVTAAVSPLPAPALEDVEVLTPMPIGPAEAELDLRVSRVASVTLGRPLIKVAAFSHGVRRALGEESRMRVAYAFRKELRRQRKLRRKRTGGRPPGMEGGRP